MGKYNPKPEHFVYLIFAILGLSVASGLWREYRNHRQDLLYHYPDSLNPLNIGLSLGAIAVFLVCMGLSDSYLRKRLLTMETEGYLRYVHNEGEEAA